MKILKEIFKDFREKPRQGKEVVSFKSQYHQISIIRTPSL